MRLNVPHLRQRFTISRRWPSHQHRPAVELHATPLSKAYPGLCDVVAPSGWSGPIQRGCTAAAGRSRVRRWPQERAVGRGGRGEPDAEDGGDVGDSASFPVPGRVRSWPKSTNCGRGLELYPLLAGSTSARPAQAIKMCTPCAAARSHTPGTRRLPLLAEGWTGPRLW